MNESVNHLLNQFVFQIHCYIQEINSNNLCCIETLYSWSCFGFVWKYYCWRSKTRHSLTILWLKCKLLIINFLFIGILCKMDIMLTFLLFVTINSSISLHQCLIIQCLLMAGCNYKRKNDTFVYFIILTAVQQWKSERVNMANAVFWLLVTLLGVEKWR